ncbi:MAG: retropepsin-like aspartic protease [Pseudomonadota bacterium]
MLNAKLIWLSGALLAASWLSAHANEHQRLALQPNDRNWPITNITINGQETPALLDTGATIALINDEFLAQGSWDEQAPETRVLGIGGHRLFPVTRIPRLTAGAQTYYNMRVAVNTRDVFPVEQNILPTSMFRTSIVDFDFPKRRVDLYDGYPKFVQGAHRSAISYIYREGLIYIPVRINGVRGRALIDTGASVSFVNPLFAELAKGRVRIDPEQDIQGSDLERNPVRMYNFRNLRFGDNQIEKFGVPVFETEMFKDLGFRDEPMMVMGMDLLGNFRLQLDQKRRRLVMLRE